MLTILDCHKIFGYNLKCLKFTKIIRIKTFFPTCSACWQTLAINFQILLIFWPIAKMNIFLGLLRARYIILFWWKLLAVWVNVCFRRWKIMVILPVFRGSNPFWVDSIRFEWIQSVLRYIPPIKINLSLMLIFACRFQF